MAELTEVDYIWKNGEMVPWAECTTHVLSHSLHYGSAVFEGARCYEDPESGKSYVFRLRDHMERLHRSCKIACIELPYTVDELCDATLELIRKVGYMQLFTFIASMSCARPPSTSSAPTSSRSVTSARSSTAAMARWASIPPARRLM